MTNLDFDYETSGTLEAVDDHIIVHDMETEHQRVVNGIILLSEQGKDRGIRPRWARVHAVGPNQDMVAPGQWVLVEHGRWTRGVKLDDGEVYRRVENDSLLLVSDDKPI